MGEAVTGEELEILVVRCLEERVPRAVVARVFGLDEDLVREAQNHVRVERHGTDDLSDYMEQLQWETVEDALRVLKNGSAAEKARVHSMVLGKQVALSARRTPESVRNSQDAVLELLTGMRTNKGKRPPAAPSKFVARRTEGESA